MDYIWDAIWPKSTSQCFFLPAEGAAEAAVIGPASKAAGTEDVVAIQQTGALVLLMAEVTHEGVDVSTVHIIQVVQIGEDASCHLFIE